MAHIQQQEFMKTVLSNLKFTSPLKVVDFGSLDINGGVRQLIESSWSYTGIDLEIGPNVDIACPGQLIDLQSEQFDICFSSELFEHTPFWKEIFAQMCRLTKPGGLVIFTCAGVGRKEHGTSRSDGGYSSPFTVSRGDEYYRNVPKSEAEKAIAKRYWFANSGFYEEYNIHDLYFVGVRRDGNSLPFEIENDLFQNLAKEYPVKFWKVQNYGAKYFPLILIENYFQLKNWLKSSVRGALFNLYVNTGLRRFRIRIRRKT